MYLFILGVILGIGLALAAQTLIREAKQLRTSKRRKLEAYIEAEVTRRQYNQDNWADLPKPPPFMAQRSGPSLGR